MSAKMRPDLAPRHHADPDDEPAHPDPWGGPARGKLAHDTDERQRPRDGQRASGARRRGVEQSQIHRRADAHEEDRREHRCHRMDLALDDVELVGAGEDEAGGEGAKDERGAGQGGEPGEPEGERDCEDDKHVAYPQANDEVEQPRDEKPADQDRDHEEPDGDGQGSDRSEAATPPRRRPRPRRRSE